MSKSAKAVYDFYRDCVGCSAAQAKKYALLHDALINDLRKKK